MRHALRLALLAVALLATFPPWLLVRRPPLPPKPYGHHLVTWAPTWPAGLKLDTTRLVVEAVAMTFGCLFVGEVAEHRKRRTTAPRVITLRRSRPC